MNVEQEYTERFGEYWGKVPLVGDNNDSNTSFKAFQQISGNFILAIQIMKTVADAV